MDDFYHLEETVLGKGNFGEVRKCTSKSNGQSYACKSIAKKTLIKRMHMEDVRQEVAILRRLTGHPNIIGFVDAIEDSEFVYIVMELCNGGELGDYVDQSIRFNEAEAAALFKEVVSGVAFCHEKDVFHRDLKLGNVLIESSASMGGDPTPRLRIIDFGLSIILKENEIVCSRVGTAHSMAPEVLAERNCGREADIWSLGVILYTLISGNRPFIGEEYDEISAKIEKWVQKGGRVTNFEDKVWERASEDLKDLVNNLLQKDPEARLTAASILAHPWLRGNKYNPIEAETSDGESCLDFVIDICEGKLSNVRFCS